MNAIKYKGYIIDYIDYRKGYRIYDPKYPAQTVAYEDYLEDAYRGIDEQGIYNDEKGDHLNG